MPDPSGGNAHKDVKQRPHGAEQPVGRVPGGLLYVLIPVADGVGVDVVVAVALLARTHWTELSHRVAEVPVLAELAPGTSPTGGALDTDRGIRVSGNFEAGATVRAGAGLAVVGGSDQRVAVEALGAPLAVVAVGVVEAGALACDGIDTTIGWHFTVIIEVVVSI